MYLNGLEKLMDYPKNKLKIQLKISNLVMNKTLKLIWYCLKINNINIINPKTQI